MSWVWAAIEIVMVIVVLMTAVAYPKESFTYGKCLLSSTVKIINWCIQYIAKINEKGEQPAQLKNISGGT